MNTCTGPRMVRSWADSRPPTYPVSPLCSEISDPSPAQRNWKLSSPVGIHKSACNAAGGHSAWLDLSLFPERAIYIKNA